MSILNNDTDFWVVKIFFSDVLHCMMCFWSIKIASISHPEDMIMCTIYYVPLSLKMLRSLHLKCSRLRWLLVKNLTLFIFIFIQFFFNKTFADTKVHNLLIDQKAANSCKMYHQKIAKHSGYSLIL